MRIISPITFRFLMAVACWQSAYCQCPSTAPPQWIGHWPSWWPGNPTGHITQVEASGIAAPVFGAGAILHLLPASGDAPASPLGVYHNGRVWAIFTQDFSPIPPSSSYNVMFSCPGPDAYVHQATAANTSSWATYLDHPLLNGQPHGMAYVTQVWTPGPGFSGYNNSFVGVWYDTSRSRWAIFNQNLMPMPVGASFHVFVRAPRSMTSALWNRMATVNPLSIAGPRPPAILVPLGAPADVINTDPFNVTEVMATYRHSYEEGLCIVFPGTPCVLTPADVIHWARQFTLGYDFAARRYLLQAADSTAIPGYVSFNFWAKHASAP